MIQLNRDYLLFQTATGEAIPCSAETVTVELIGDSASVLDPEMIQNAAAAVLHYFKYDLQRTVVSIHEFSRALERVLRSLGFTVETEDDVPLDQEDARPQDALVLDLRQLVPDPDPGLELAFFCQLRRAFQLRIQGAPELVRCNGLRPCVKQLIGAKRWNSRCQVLSDQIVSYLRHCFQSGKASPKCQLVIE